MIILVAYSDKTRVIGKLGEIPWTPITEDLKNFKRLTENNIVIMGRKTYESLPLRFRPLPNRTNIILSSTLSSEAQQGIIVCRTIEEVLEHLSLPAYSEKCVYVIGGQNVYEEFLARGLVKKILASVVHQAYAGDTYFPYPPGLWMNKVLQCYKDFTLVEYRALKP